MMKFRQGHGSTFASGADRSGGALGAEAGGLESAKDAARRLHIRPWAALNKYSGSLPFTAADEWHHVRTRVDGLSRVVRVDYREPDEWDRIVHALRVARSILG